MLVKHVNLLTRHSLNLKDPTNYYLRIKNQIHVAATTALTRPCEGTGGFLKRETCRSQTATDVMVRLNGP